MTTILHPIRSLRESLHQIGAAVNASREDSHAGSSRDAAEKANPATAAIPLYSIGPKIGIDFRKARCVDSKS